ncbi:hypothetical protein OCF84_21435 (plasmid) [Shewanella xiamenensis]|uniref:Uncharacterized protein n=1 Tax=Shewanella xiamenensis TaxID=332186 RepID=A0ABT6UDL2_9GAMM|nr:hypothetical protein [Shewanella xiamenensis]MDI5832560.1 hypothetical protein [Shewanella xiamenensis]WHF57822.1 hypothetical protein OCF84_21435 [Shewanella xiamenensis]
MNEYTGISVSAVKSLIVDQQKSICAIAKPFHSGSILQGGGYTLNIIDGEQTFVVASYRSNTKLYKRADALLNDAKVMGLKAVKFEL